MKKVIYVIGAAALMVLVACQKENSGSQNIAKFITLPATFEEQSEGDAVKSYLGNDKKVYWTEGDKVQVFDETGASVELTATTGGATSTTFCGEAPGEYTPCCAIYPSCGATYNTGIITVNIPATQNYKENTFDEGANVAVGTVSENGIVFVNSCGVLKLQLTGNFKVGKIKVTGCNNEKLNGAFTVNSASPSHGAIATDERVSGDNVITLDCTENGGVQLNGTAKVFHIVVPTGAFADGFVARIYDVDNNHEFSLVKTSSANTIARSVIKVMPEVAADNRAFTEREYLESYGDEYLNTNYAWTTLNKKVEFIFKPKGISTLTHLFGSTGAKYDLNFYSSSDANVAHWGWYIGQQVLSSMITANTKTHIVAETTADLLTVRQDDLTREASCPSIELSGKPVYIFDCNTQSGNYNKLSAFLYEFSMYDNLKLVRYFVPCCCGIGRTYTDGNTGESVTAEADTPGMLDLRSGDLFINQGSGSFTCGPVVF